jgi:hypothetical protein
VLSVEFTEGVAEIWLVVPGSTDVATSLFDVVAVREGDEKDVFGVPDVVDGTTSVVAGTVCDVPVGSKVFVELVTIVFEVGISPEVVEV